MGDGFNESFLPTKKVRDGKEVDAESEIDLIIEENGILYPIEIKQGAKVTADEAAAFTVLDKIENKTRGADAILCLCPQPASCARMF